MNAPRYQAFCTDCGTRNDTGDRFCVSCGTDLALDADEVTSGVAPQAGASAIPEAEGATPARTGTARRALAVVVVAAVAAGGGWLLVRSVNSQDSTAAVPPQQVASPSEDISDAPSPDPSTERASSTGTATGIYVGRMGGSNDTYKYRLTLREFSDGRVAGTAYQRDSAGEEGVERLRGSRAGNTVNLRGVGWDWADNSGWLESVDTFQLRFSGPERAAVSGTYSCITCADTSPHSMNPVTRR